MATVESQVITASEVRQAESDKRSLITKSAERYGLEPNKMMATLKATAFKGDVTNEQMAALLIVADQHGLNPWTKEIYAFPSRQGIVPVVGVDGWARIVNSHPQFDGMDFAQDDEKCTCTIHRKDRSHPVSVTEYAIECKRDTDPWRTHPKRMLRHKAMIQCARIAFAFAGIYDPDEAERVLAAEDAIDVTPARPPPPTLTLNDEGKPEFQSADGTPYVAGKKISAVRMRKIVEGLEAAVTKQDGPGLLEIRNELDNDEWMQVCAVMRSWDRTAYRKLEDEAKEAAGPAPHLAPWALELLAGCKDAVALKAAWDSIQGAYDESGALPPGDVETVYLDRKNEIGIQG